MHFKQKYFFFRCYHCGEWFYTKKIIKTKKCWKCNRTFLFRKSTKFSKKCSMRGAIAILKELKKRRKDEDLSEYMNVYDHLIKKKM
ncbi:MAG: DUF1922 domain-containing protein [Promethearchaeota archaeon]|nr:MAG: DUF1922 domain-containing protein [Candidatus Lokiarchaeota archaeon]